MRVTKKFRTAHAAFKNRVIDELKTRGAVEHDGLYDFKLETPIGDIGISVWESAIMCRLWSVEAGRRFTEQHCPSRTCNRYSGKWNHHYTDDATTLNAVPEVEFFFYLDKLLIDALRQDLSSLSLPQHESCVAHLGRLPLHELRRRQDLNTKQIETAHRQLNESALSNLHIRDEHLRAAVERKEFAESPFAST